MTDEQDVLAVARAFFEGPRAYDDDLKCGALLEWSRLRGEPSWSARYSYTHTLESVELLELGAARAVVRARGEIVAVPERGSHRFHHRIDGPAALERVDGEWRVADFTLDGRRRSNAIVWGPLAEQDHDRVTMTVLGVDRQASGTEIAVRIANARGDAISVDAAFALFEASNAWRPARIDSRDPIETAESRALFLGTGQAVALEEPELLLALRLRTGRRKLPFTLRVPLTPQETPVRQAPPRRLPLLRWTRTTALFFYAAVTAGAAWFYSWWALIAPVYVGLVYYRHYRVHGLLPTRLWRFRFVADVAVLAAAFLVLWETPAVELAVPAAVGVLVYLAAHRLRPRRESFAQVAALSVAAGWLLVLGLDGERLSTCRIADGRPEATADAFARAELTGEFARARSLEFARLRRDDPALGVLRPKRVSEAAAAVSLRHRSPCRFEFGFRIDRCYAYPASYRGKRGSMFVSVGCHERSWQVRAWFP